MQVHKTAVDYLGFQIENSVSPIHSIIGKITYFPFPTSKSRLKILTWLITFFES